MDVDALIAKARQHLAAVEPVTQDVMLGDEVVGVRVWQMVPSEWRDLTAVHRPRPGAARDAELGYNPDAVTKAYPRVALVRGEDVDDLMVEVDGKSVSRWPEVFEVLEAPHQYNVSLAVWGLNEYEAQKRMFDAGKASRGGRRKKRSSPANSA